MFVCSIRCICLVRGVRVSRVTVVRVLERVPVPVTAARVRVLVQVPVTARVLARALARARAQVPVRPTRSSAKKT